MSDERVAALRYFLDLDNPYLGVDQDRIREGIAALKSLESQNQALQEELRKYQPGPECGWPEDDGRDETCRNDWHDWELREAPTPGKDRDMTEERLESENQALQEENQRLLEQGKLWQQALADELRNSVALQGRAEKAEARLRGHETCECGHTLCQHFPRDFGCEDLHGPCALSPTQETDPE